jgi:very-short-patch-repair endonuclease
VLAERRQELENADLHPLAVETSAFLQGFVNCFSSQGTFHEGVRPEPGGEHPAIGRGPILFLRTRTKGFGNAIAQVVKSIEARAGFCDALLNFVGSDTAPHDGESSHRSHLKARDILFAKEANQEQFRIADRLNRHGSVLVQGPPGTGKSHTIANLIGHLLAHGQSVLVTSHTTKALRVLREHVIEDLRPLCVSVLDNDLESREQLKESVTGIANRLGESNEGELSRQAEELARRRNELSDILERSREELQRARTNEYRAVVVGSKGYTPSEAARVVAAGRGEHNWIPGPVAYGEPLPLSEGEVQELYASNATTLPSDDQLSGRPLPAAEHIPTEDDFSLAIEAKQTSYVNKLWMSLEALRGKLSVVEELALQFQEAIAEFRAFGEWQLAAVEAGRGRVEKREAWDELLRRAAEIRDAEEGAQSLLVRHSPRLGGTDALDEQRRVVNEILEHLQGGGALTRWRPFGRTMRGSWRSSYDTWSVNDRPPETAEEFDSIRRLIDINIGRRGLQPLWQRLMAANAAPAFVDLGEQPERGVLQYGPPIANCLNWWNERWARLTARLAEIGFDWNGFVGQQPPSFAKYGEMLQPVNAVESTLLAELEKATGRVNMIEAERKLGRAAGELERFDRPEVAELRQAIVFRDTAVFRAARKKCLDAAGRRAITLRRAELLNRLERRSASGEPVAEAWAAKIRRREGDHGKPTPPGNATAAWEWRQLNDELDRRTEFDPEQLGARIASAQEDFQRATCELIDKRAWASQVRRTTLKQRQALMGWLKTIQAIGKGTGRRAPRLKKTAQGLMKDCRTAVPVWIMPLARLVDSFDFNTPCFDVVIIDEASQCDVMANLALVLAKKVVIVGDDEQVSPLAVGQKQDNVQHLIDLHLEGVPNAQLYTGEMSIYDLAKQSFAGLISLAEHFRCAPDIIQFSNHLCYQGRIKPLRENSSSPLSPRVIPVRVEGVRNAASDVNREEALATASLVMAAIERPEYQGMTFGVIALQGNDQAPEIEALLLKHLPPDEYQRRRIICGNSAQFQGDERDVIFLSMVWAAGTGPLRFLDEKRFRQRFNVAASRARDQMWLVYSLDPAVDLKPGDLRRRLIEHALDPQAVTRDIEHLQQRTQSPFEKEVLGFLVRAGYRVTPQWEVGSYSIDFVVEGGGNRTALECDGDRYHPLEKLPDDMERQAILERLGWRFIRIRGSAFFRDPKGTMDDVFRRLKEMDITPEGGGRPQPSGNEPLVAELQRRAAEIRATWQSEPGATANLMTQVESPIGPGKVGGQEPAETVAEIEIKSPPAPKVPKPESRVPSGKSSPRTPLDEPKAPADRQQAGKLSTQAVDLLIAALDRAFFPAVAGTEPKAARRTRIERWRSALTFCDSSTSEATYAALVKSDPSISKAGEKAKAISAIHKVLKDRL